jgi:hypothetical protein
MHEQDRRFDLTRVEPPWRDVGEVVVDHPARTALQRLFVHGQDRRPRTLERRSIGTGEELGVELAG